MEPDTENTIEALLPEYFLGKLSPEGKALIESWKAASLENQTIFNEYKKVWESIDILHQMEGVDTMGALRKVTAEINLERPMIRFVHLFQKIAAVLLLPLIVYTSIVTYNNWKEENRGVTWQTIVTKQGMQNELDLPDGSHVWLNSGSVLKYPVKFARNIREIKVTGEALFKVYHDKNHPFIVNTGKMNIEVLGTTFNVVNYPADHTIEVVLAEGKVNLFSGSYDKKTDIGILEPGQRAVFDVEKNQLMISNVEVDKYLAWKDGKLIFADDPMAEVAKKLGRWFNADIIVEDPEINSYLYTAKFHTETLKQVLELLKFSSPIEYKTMENKKLANGEYSKQQIYIKKRR